MSALNAKLAKENVKIAFTDSVRPDVFTFIFDYLKKIYFYFVSFQTQEMFQIVSTEARPYDATVNGYIYIIKEVIDPDSGYSAGATVGFIIMFVIGGFIIGSVLGFFLIVERRSSRFNRLIDNTGIINPAHSSDNVATYKKSSGN
jgi:hypothetical protein